MASLDDAFREQGVQPVSDPAELRIPDLSDNEATAFRSAVRGPLRWHYGPTWLDAEPSKMWCVDCRSEVFGFDNGYVCTDCGRQEEMDE